MSLGSKPVRIGWKVSLLSMGIASVRYRALLPMLALESQGIRSKIFRSAWERHLDGLDVLVIVKSLTLDDLHLAQQAVRKGIRVVFDLCDNIFIDAGYGGFGKAAPARVFNVIAAQADAIVVTTEPLAALVRERAPGVPVVVIPDGIDLPVLSRGMHDLLEKAKAIEKMHRMDLLRGWLRNRARKLIERVRERGFRAFAPYVVLTAYYGWRMLRQSLDATSAFVLRRRIGRAHPATPAPQTSKVILWFGNHGAPYARFGMLDLLEIREALEAVAQTYDVQLVVISNHRKKYEESIRPIRIPSHYIEWSPSLVQEWLGRADVVVVPNTLDSFSLCKSANRTVLAVSMGVPVVATPTPALEQLAPYIHTGSAEQGLRRYLSDRDAGRRDAQAAFALAQKCFGQVALAGAWKSVISQVSSLSRMVETMPVYIVVLNLVQDMDLALPVLDVWQRKGVPVQVWCSISLPCISPRVLSALRKRGIPFRLIPDNIDATYVDFPSSAKALLTITETDLSPHRFSRRLTIAALERGLVVATMQHGFENVGLTYDDAVHPIQRVSIKAQRIYIWGDRDTLHPRVSEDVRARCISVGCVKPAFVEPADLRQLLPQDRPIVGVFENLHWHRYDDAYRHAFLDAVNLAAQTFPDVTFLVKPHHAGLWLTRRHTGQLPTSVNIVIADPDLTAWEQYTAQSLLGNLRAVITSPSTVALDAARQRLPVAVFAGNLNLSNYAPLPSLETADDAAAFIRAVFDDALRIPLIEASSSFTRRVLVEGDGAEHIVADLAAAVQK
ncbi:glycosyltransferase [Hylemonella sp. W303a]|uniref:glycosyltransferase n=1 Tax=Hylemonella sp. W303a TaxID=3389873 RepID=UPI00396AF86D